MGVLKGCVKKGICGSVGGIDMSAELDIREEWHGELGKTFFSRLLG